MEKKSFSNSLKDHSIGSKAIREINNDNNHPNINQLKDSWSSSQGYAEDYLGGLSWPPRSYTCSFCKREFRSAQALGGHMNVHRRDRARLRQSPSRDGKCHFLNLNSNPNPSPKLIWSSSSSLLSNSRPSSFVSPTLSSLSSASPGSSSEMKKRGMDHSALKIGPLSPKSSDLSNTRGAKSIFGIEEFGGTLTEDNSNGHKFFKKAEILRLDLEIGLLGDCESKEGLDLELRLGYS